MTRLAGTGIVSDHNLEFADAADLFLAPPYDLRLLSGAAAVDTGSFLLAPATDVERLRRPQGAGIDLGAYERCLECIFKDGFASPPGG